MFHPTLKQQILCVFYCFMISGISISEGAPSWKLPSADEARSSLDACYSQAAGEDAAALKCLVEQLGLWTDESDYNAKRIAKIFAGHNQIEELIVVINYCNEIERRARDPDVWAYEAYKCATSGRFGSWVREYMNQEK